MIEVSLVWILIVDEYDSYIWMSLQGLYRFFGFGIESKKIRIFAYWNSKNDENLMRRVRQ